MSEQIKEMFSKPVHERALLAFCFESMDNYYTIASMVEEEDFLRPDHKLIWVIFGTLAKRKVKKFDSSMIINEAKNNSILDSIGGYDYVNAVASMNVDSENIDFYVKMLLDASTKYKLYMKLDYDIHHIGKNADDEDVTAADLIGKVGKDVMDLSMKSKAIRAAKNLSEGLDEYIEERRNNPVDLCGLSTGFSILDRQIDGLINGTLTVFCARPKHGKSTFLSNIAAYVAYDLMKPVLYVDTEMSFDEWRPRVLSMLSGVPERVIKHGGYSDQQYRNLVRAAEIVKKGKLFHEYIPGYSVDKLITVYKRYSHVENIELAVFDYIKEPSDGKKERKEYQILGDVTTALKDLAGELNIPFLCANQLNRQEDIADSDRILRYADVLMFFKTKTEEEIEKYGLPGGTHKLIITDSRRGGTTSWDGIGYKFLKKFLTITEADVQPPELTEKEYKEKEEVEYGSISTTDVAAEQKNDEDYF